MKINPPLKSTAWLLLEKAVYLLISFVVTVALARYLQPTQFGNLNYLLALIALFLPIMSVGLNSIVSRELLLRPAAADKIMGSSLFLRFIASVSVVLVVVGFSGTYLAGDNQILFAILMVASVASAGQTIDFWLQAKLANHYAVLMRLLVLIGFSLMRLFAIYETAKFPVFIYLIAAELTITGLLYLVIYQRLSGRLLELKINSGEIKRLWRDSRWLLMSGIAAVIYLKIDQVMLGVMVDNYAVGVYAAAARVSEVWYFIPAAIVTSFFPKLVRNKQVAAATYQVDIQKLNDILLIFAVSIAVLMTIIGDDLVAWLFGPSYSESSPIVLVHIWGAVFVFMRELFSKWLLAESLLTFSLLSQGLGALANVALNYFLIPTYGALGAAYATVISYSIAGYLVLFIHPKLWPMARVITRSFLLPLRFARYGKRLYSMSDSN